MSTIPADIVRQHESVATDPERCPPEPWVAAALNTGIAAHMDTTEWLSAFWRGLFSE